jgi:hypothetical protein
MRSKSDPKPRHPFFRVMVVMGGSMAVGCGGKTTTSESNTTHTGEGSQGGGPLGEGGSAVNLVTAGSAMGGEGGDPNVIHLVEMAGAPPQPVAVDPGPFACAPAQWDCSKDGPSCSSDGVGWRLPENCPCDTSRPNSPDECREGEMFVCRQGIESADQHPLTSVVPFECACAPRQKSCVDTCARVYMRYDMQCLDPTDPSARAILCGCALPYLN